MELFERVRYLAEIKGLSLARFGKMLGFPQQTFHKWLSPQTQKHLFDHLPKILELFPDVRPEWLYIGQEPAFHDGTQAENQPTRDEMEELKRENERLKSELAEADRLNRKLTARMLIDGVGDKDNCTVLGTKTIATIPQRRQGKAD